MAPADAKGAAAAPEGAALAAADIETDAVPHATAAVKLDALPPAAAHLFSALHANQSGEVDEQTLQHAADVLAEFEKNSGQINMALLPRSLQDSLSIFDVNADGMLDVREVQRAAELYHIARMRVKTLVNIIVVLCLLLVVFAGVLGGIMFAVVERTKEVRVNHDGVMMNANRSAPLTVAALLHESAISSLMPGASHVAACRLRHVKRGCVAIMRRR
jgi:hypothetical protein